MDGAGMIRMLRRSSTGRTRRTALTTALGGITLAALGVSARSPEVMAKKKRCQCKAKALGDSCTSNKQCCTNQTNRICSFRNQSGGGLKCCGALGASCSGTTDCCFSFDCLSGSCVAAA